METQAAINGLNWLKHNRGTSEYVLLSDSMLLVKTANEWSFKWKSKGWRIRKRGEPKNLDLVKELHELYLFHNGHFKWVKGHYGNKWNEYCDDLCRQSDEFNIDKVMGLL